MTDETGTPDGVGRFNHFEGGSIYWTPQLGAHEVHGAIRNEWQRCWGMLFLRYPASDERDMPGGWVSLFEGGKIEWTPSGGAVTTKSTKLDDN